MAEIKIGRMAVGIYQTNCYFLYREGEHEAIVVDAPDQGRQICLTLEQNGFHVAGIFLTHGHFDHIWGAEELRQEADARAKERGAEPVKIYACEGERELLLDTRMNVSQQMHRPCKVEADVYVRDGDEITIAGMNCKVIATPGHTAGGCCFYFPQEGYLLCGDTLFLESVGRTDFPTGSMGTLARSVKEKLFVLPDETKVYPGHGDSTTIEHEKRYNPFLQ